MAGRDKVGIRVISQSGTCVQGHKVGDQWVIEEKTPEGVCLFAFNSLLFHAQVLKFGGSFPWETDPDVVTVACPDPGNPVVFELRRLHE